MPPERGQKRKAGGKDKGKNVKKQPKQSQQEARDPSLSVSKIKGNIRQTTRWLRRDDIDQVQRSEAEQKLEELQAQLKVAQEYDARIKLEQENAVKYHGIKFFERKKLTRRIKQVKTRLASAAADAEKSDKKEIKSLTKELESLRVDLNYVLHFPKADRYIALFPDGQYASPKDDKKEDSPANQKRREVRKQMSKAMQQGTLNAEPEVELDLRRQRQKERHGGSDSEDEDSENGESDANEDDDEGGASAQVPQWGTKWKAWKDPANQPDGPGFVAKEGAPEEEDDFFE